MDNSIEIRDLYKDYKTFSLNHISFELKNGSIMGFIGENGAGKSTTTKCMLNIIKKDSGTVKILGMDMDKKEQETNVKSQIGVVLDECHFHDTLNVKSIKLFMPKIYKNWDSKLFQQYTQRFGLPDDKLIKDYSKGMKMKLSIGAAMSHHPNLLILDEATSGLDPIVRDELMDIFLEYIQDENHSILLSSHITSDLEKICDYITLIHKGNLLLCDEKDAMIYDHVILKCKKADYDKLDHDDIIGSRRSSFCYEVLMKNRDIMERKYSFCTFNNVTLENLMLFYTKGEQL